MISKTICLVFLLFCSTVFATPKNFKVVDDGMLPPSFTGCPPADVVITPMPGTCGSAVTWTPPIAVGAVSVTSNYSPGETFFPGTTTVIYTAIDAIGDTATCSFDVIVTDNEAPVLTGPSDTTINADAGTCSATVTYATPTVTDNCPAGNGNYPIFTDFEVPSRNDLIAECWQFFGTVTSTNNPLSGVTSMRTSTLFSAGARTLISPLAYFNGTGQITFLHRIDRARFNNRITVSLVDELDVPTVIFTEIYTNNSVQAEAIDVTQTGNFRVRIDFETNSNSPDRGRVDDLLIPALNIADTSGSGACPAANFQIVQTTGLPSGSGFPVGITTNSFEVVDAFGNVGTYSFDVTVIDSEDPTASNPTPIVVGCIGDVPPPDPTVVTDEADNCGPPTVAHVSDNQVGNVITRIYSVTDAESNSINVQQTITISDTTAPVPDLASLPDLVSECSLNVVTVPTSTDNCTGTVTGSTVDPLFYDVQGSYVITWTYDDGNGNVSQQTQNVTIQDMQAPVPDVVALPDLTVDCPYTASAPTAMDNCVGSVTATTSDMVTFTTDGSFTIDWTYDDGNGNIALQTQNVVVTCMPEVDLMVEKNVAPLQAGIGETVAFTITVSNLSTTEATNISIEELLPNGYSYQSHTVSQGSYDEIIGEWSIPSVLGGQSETLTIEVTIVDGTEYENIASISFLDQMDNNPDNDIDSAAVLPLEAQSDCLVFFNEFTPNRDGLNDVFFIECLDRYPSNNLQIFNRWGVKVFEMENYDNSWEGISQGRATIGSTEKLPTGTYYYIFESRDGSFETRTGWLYLIR